jgi:putative transposase
VTVSRPGVLRAGAEIRLGGQAHTVVAVTGSSARLADVTGQVAEVPLARLLSDPSLELVAGTPAPLPPAGMLETLPEDVLDHAWWWERHIVEVLAGRPPQSAPGLAAKPEYDPSATTLRQRELAKAAGLEAGGHRVPLSTLQRLRVGYEREGLRALIDGRTTRRTSPAGRVDHRVVEAAGRRSVRRPIIRPAR